MQHTTVVVYRSPAVNAMRFLRLLSVFVLFAGLVLAGTSCRGPEAYVPGEPFYPVAFNPFQETPSERDSIVAVLEALDPAPLQQAFAGLDRHNFTRYTRTEQFDEDDFLIAYEETVVRHETRGAVRMYLPLAADSAGAFDYGYFSRFVSETVSSQDPPDLAAYVLPEDPPYLSDRNRDAYTYRFMPDTLMWDMVARVIEVRARPNEGDGLNVRRVRLYVDRGSQALIGMYLERIDLAMLFREESRYYLHVRPSPNGTWVPYNTRFESRISVPFRPAQLFRTVSTYYNYEPAL